MIGPWHHCVHMRKLIDIYVSSAAPLSRSQRSLIRAGHRERCNSRSRARRTVLATFGKLLRVFPKVARFVARRFKKKVAKGV